MFTLAHLSDWHLASRPAPSELIGKRGLGYINWHRARKKIHRPDVLDATIRDLKAVAPDHIAVTGDLVNLSLADEYNRARGWLQTLGSPRDVTLVPGNHDVYVRSVLQAPAKYWADYMRGDDGLDRFPFVRRRGNVALIGLSTALPTAPLLATGRLGKRQLARLLEILDQTRGSFRIVLIHHPPLIANAICGALSMPRICAACSPTKAPSFCCTATITAARWSGSTGRRRKSPRSACRRRRRAASTAMKTPPATIYSASTAR